MNNLKHIIILFLFSALAFSCGNNTQKQENETKPEAKEKTSQNQETGWEDIMPSIVTIDSYDDNRILESGQGFFITENLVVTKYSLVNASNNVLISPFDTDEKFKTGKYVAVDRINDLIILQKELDGIEEENDYTFSPEQRQAYKTVGGAPHLDGTYPIFGEVISGMDVVDAIEKVETDRQWRPVDDIRLKNIRILK